MDTTGQEPPRTPPKSSPPAAGTAWPRARLALARNGSCSNAAAVARLAGSASKQRRMKVLALSDMDSGTSGCILNMPTWRRGPEGPAALAGGVLEVGTPPRRAQAVGTLNIAAWGLPSS